ncbi:uncharacterized protein LOC110820531 isoform X4 [Carica papaya]|uniref:uncharacterized protein LOC110820531 isoform X4 n=1 Tax=Carica papaya TaxID=3649 RepID=UPI000B8D0602|nr:uncharacterized protein LOC110820531 isoform X4 [Carica papaya]
MAEIEEDSLEEMTDAESYSADEVEDLFESKQNNCWKSSPELHGASSSKLEPDDDSTSVRKSPYKVLACSSMGGSSKFPKHIKLKIDMNIEDVVKENVLPFLPAKSLYRYKTVSRAWNQWISSPFLELKQTNQFKDISGLFSQFPGENPSFISFNQDAYGIPVPSLNFLPESVNIRTTCNGLVCCQARSEEDHSIVQFEIYSSRTNSWRVADAVCCEEGWLNLSAGCYMKGVVYWETSRGGILAFDLKHEEYGILSLPPSKGPNGALVEINGELSYILPKKQDNFWEIYVYGNMNMSLKGTISLDPEIVGETYGVCQALTCINSDLLIILLGTKVITYRVRTRKLECFYDMRINGVSKYLPYVNSLIPVARPRPEI